MPNYSLIANSTFQPFTYQELAAPLDRQELYHEKLAEEYDKLSSQADVLEAMGNNDRDKHSGSYNKYKAYSDSLRAEADNLYQFGLNTESRQRLSDLRRRYNTEIVPIQNAWSKREQEADLQLKASMQNPSLMFTRDASTTSLDDYIANPTGGFGTINGANITAQMSQMASNLAKQIRSGVKENIDDYTYKYINKYGLTPDFIKNWRNSPTLSKMFEQVMQANGVTPEALNGSLNAQSIIDKSTGYAEMGMWNAIGEDKATIQENFINRLNAQEAKEKAVIEAEYMAKAKAAALANQGSLFGDIREEGAGIITEDGYVTNARELIEGLRGGQNSWKAKYFGRTSGDVNPLKIYEEYKNELEKHSRTATTSSYSPSVGGMVPSWTHTADTNAAKRAVLEKYKKYGVTDIISPEQYQLLKSSGYNSNSSFKNVWYNDVYKNLDNLVKANTRYSTTMANYDAPDEWIRGRLMNWDEEGTFQNARVWELGKNGKMGDLIDDIKELNLYSADNTNGGKVNDIQYDPHYKGKLLVSLSNGKRFLCTPDAIDQRLTNELQYWETREASPHVITARIKQYLNMYNPVRSKTDKDA